MRTTAQIPQQNCPFLFDDTPPRSCSIELDELELHDELEAMAATRIGEAA